ncbi:ATP-binding cassette domain-containing protein [Bradyrhizobium sp. STM 3561]|uniref:ATP-binding cassette domain-containing protein n=1 Tax=Bradyrhizobium sp. STM 3561 TaxID=578923 RepID=UPI00388E6554
MRSLDISRSEHRTMWQLATALSMLGTRLSENWDTHDLHTVELILDYFEQFTERFHHPKEDDHLFARLRQRSNEADGVLTKLHDEHETSPEQLARIRALVKAEPGPRRGQALAESIESFRAHLDAHMKLEEEGTFALARKVLTPADWAEIDAAFESHADPLTQADAAGEMALLRQRIIQLLPAPEGLGGDEDPGPAHASLTAPRAGRDLLQIRDLRTRYGRIQVLHGISIRVGEGELVALVGANGAGKTTLLRCISGVQPTSAGTILFGKEAITSTRSAARVRSGICHSPEGRQVFGPMSIEDNLIMGAYTRPSKDIAAGLSEVYDLFPILREKRALPAGTLSGGQQQMLALGRALMGRPKLLLLDEPSMGLAPLIVEEIFRIIRTLKQSGMTILLVEQNARAALSIADYAYVLETGKVTLEGLGHELLANDDVRRAYLGM